MWLNTTNWLENITDWGLKLTHFLPCQHLDRHLNLRKEFESAETLC